MSKQKSPDSLQRKKSKFGWKVGDVEIIKEGSKNERTDNKRQRKTRKG